MLAGNLNLTAHTDIRTCTNWVKETKTWNKQQQRTPSWFAPIQTSASRRNLYSIKAQAYSLALRPLNTPKKQNVKQTTETVSIIAPIPTSVSGQPELSGQPKLKLALKLAHRQCHPNNESNLRNQNLKHTTETDSIILKLAHRHRYPNTESQKPKLETYNRIGLHHDLRAPI